jgi:hypothetical protein
MQLTRVVPICLVIAMLPSCASVPKESVELSTTVGRDITVLHKSHRNLAKLMFGRMRRDVNRFVDNVYAPYQINSVMEKDFKTSKSNDENDRRSSILLAINNAFRPEASETLQRQVLESMGTMVSLIRDDVESMRHELLDSIDQQENVVLDAIDRNYAQIIYSNSIVTGYLSSVAKVHDAQNEILNAIGLEADLSELIGKKLASASDKIAGFVQAAEQVDATADTIYATIDSLKSTLNGK